MKALEPGQPLHALTGYRQFLNWRNIPNPKPEGKPIKMPVDPRTGYVCDAHNPSLWLSHTEALSFMRPGDGFAFVFTKDDPFFFLDIDNAYDGQSWSQQATDLYNRFQGCAWETSISGKGAHIFGRTAPIEHAKKNVTLGLELYTEKRFVALTGDGATGDANTDATPIVHQIVPQLFPPKQNGGVVALTDSPDSEWNGPQNDDELIEKMLKVRGANATFNGKASFRDLWECNTAVLSDCFPDTMGDQGRAFDGSSADAALAQHLAFWTGKHGTRMVELMKRSALVRDKWDKHKEYLSITVLSACNMQRDVYKMPVTQQVAVPEPHEIDTPRTSIMRGEARLATGVRILPVTQQLDYFKGCLYVSDENKILTPDGSLLDKSRFSVIYGGYEFMMDTANTKVCKNAWETYTESKAIDFPQVHATGFRPDLQEREIYKEGHRYIVNDYKEIPVDCRPGDTSRFTNHLAKLLPDEKDRLIVLSYMAACVQHKGVKFQWCPLLQGTKGNGKTLITECVAEAIGMDHVHMPKAKDIDNKFNAWLYGKIFIGVEDIYVPEHKSEVIETIKPMITGNKQDVQKKGIDQATKKICCNFMLNSNHRNAVGNIKDERRFAIFYTAQQTHEDIIRDGMGGDYFPKLYAWLRAEGYAYVTHLLKTMVIPDEYNPATNCQRAPETTSTHDAIKESMGTVEQEIEEVVEEGRIGFNGGWISSLALSKLLESLKADRRVPPRKRPAMLESLGYIKHPHLTDGRTTKRIDIDNGRPRLYIKKGNPAGELRLPCDIEKAYVNAQLMAG